MFLPIRALVWLLLPAVTLSLLTQSCTRKSKPVSEPQKYAEFISAYTSGAISSESDIRIILVQPANSYTEPGGAAPENLIEFNPKIDGELQWEDQYTLIFKPAAQLPSGESFEAQLNLSKLANDVSAELNTFNFRFSIITQVFEVARFNLRTYERTDLTVNKIEGEILSTDVADLNELEALLQVTQNGESLPLAWRSDASRTHHYLVVDSIARTEQAQELQLNWAENVGETYKPANLNIPALGDFTVLGAQVVQQPEQKVIINFSDPLLAEQNVQGLVDFESDARPNFLIEDTELHVFTKETLSGDRLLTLFPGIKNAAGFALKEQYQTTVTFADLKPAVELIGSGSILPASSGLSLPFKAVNLKMVDVYVLKIFSSNVPQFLQTNQLEGSYQLKRVGRPIAHQRINLSEGGTELKRWNTFSIDLAEIMKPEPGAIYRVELKFKPAYSLYNCPGKDSPDELVTMEPDEELNTSGYDSPDYYYSEYYYDYYWEDYDYQQRDNPCNAAYFTSSRNVSRNILATDLGLTVKGSDHGEFQAFVTDLNSAKPVSGATVQILNYQQQLLAEGKTAADGSVRLELEAKPFLAIAEHFGQSTYLRIDDGSALSMSNFDVAGGQMAKGLKGFLYAERGVWRPGDTVFMQFMLEDREKTLPAKHPVIFEVRNPEGKMVERYVRNTNVSGIYSFPFATDSQAMTGFYSCRAKVGGASFHKTVRIETIKPNRLKVALAFAEPLSTGKPADATIRAQWLTGATARNLKTDVQAQIRMQRTPFEKWAKYDFIDDTRRFRTSEKDVFKGALNANGETTASIDLGTYSRAPGMLEAVFLTRVFEQGGEFSIDRQALPLAPFSHFVGMQPPKPTNAPWLTTDQPINVQLVTVDAEGNQADRNVSATVYAIDWSWWWSSGRNGMANYLNSSYARSIHSETIETQNGKGAFQFEVKYPNYGNYLVRICDEESGHCTSQIVYIDWPMSRDRGGRANPGAPTMLTFSADQEEYGVGEVAHLSIPSSGSGRLLVSLETGSRILKHMWLDAEEGQTEVDIPITEEMAPNVYAFVSYIQPHAETANDLPIRLYGVIPIVVNDRSTELTPIIKTATEWQPEKQATITVSEQQGRPMTYTLAIVDEGLLDITRFKTPDPWNFFYAKEALGVRTWDHFDEVMGAFGGVIAKNFAIGGDEEIDPAGKKRLNRFKPLVKVMGPFTLAAGEKTNHAFTMPNYIGSAKVMVVARQDESYGHVDKRVPVRKPLMVLATVPRVLGPDDSFRLPVQVFAMREGVRDVRVSVKSNKLLNVIDGEKTITFNEVGDEIIYFDVVAKDLGKATLDISVKSGKEQASYNVAVDVRNPLAVETKTFKKIIPPGETHTFSISEFGMPGGNALAIQASAIPDLQLADAIGYLLRYPHGCIEQTISAAFPQLVLADIIQFSDGQSASSKENILYAIKKLQANQLASGAFSTWPSRSYISNWSTTYAGHFIIEAEKRGYTIPAAMKSKWLDYEKRTASNWRHNTNQRWGELEQSYRLYVLALAGQPQVGAMNRMRNLSLHKPAAWRLAAAYAVIGQADVAQALIRGTLQLATGRYYDPTFGNEMRASAMRLETYVWLQDKDEAFEQAIILAKQLNNRNLYTTQSTAYALLSMSQFLAGRKSETMQFAWQADQEGETVKQSGTFYMKDLNAFHEEITVSNAGSEDIYIAINQTGQPLPGEESAEQNQVKLSVEYKSLNNSVIDPTSITQGTDFKVVVRLSSQADRYKLNDMALSQIFPSGWEIFNTRFLGVEDVSAQSASQYRDFRDDRVYTYFGMNNTKTYLYEVRLNAAYLGRFYVPGARVEAMYYPDVKANEKGKWVEVIKPE